MGPALALVVQKPHARGSEPGRATHGPHPQGIL